MMIMTFLIAILLAVLPNSLMAAGTPPSPAERPNILWILVEDIGCDMACYGNKVVHTPNLDRLAAEGAMYTSAFTIASVCSPSRAGFMTGLYANQVYSQNMRIRPPW